MDKTQKRNLWVLAFIGLIYFIAFIFPNTADRGSDSPAGFLHKDEFVTYPIVERMLALGPDLSTAWGKLIIYQDYHYGYPFYFFSMLALLPRRLIRGQAFFADVKGNILILRQLINVLPIVLTAGVFAYVATEFRKLPRALFIFLSILFIPGIIRQSMHWWHPDALMMLSIALTFLFLKLDDGRLGRYFNLAAAACGMASAIKLMGFFFFLTIPLYLIFVWRRENYPFKKILLAALFFVLVMAAVIVLSNPFLFYRVPREEMITIQTGKSDELTAGYGHEDSLYYSLGPRFWRWTLETSFGEPNYVILLFSMFLLYAIANPREIDNWLMIAWLVPMGVYLLWFVAPKPDHYLFPLLIPLFSTVLAGFDLLKSGWSSETRILRWLAKSGFVLYALLFTHQWIFQIARAVEQYPRYFPPK